MGNYARGRSLEYTVMDIWRKAGWKVMRGSSSKGDMAIPENIMSCKHCGGMKVDVLASVRSPYNVNTVWMVPMQCKRAKRQ